MRQLNLTRDEVESMERNMNTGIIEEHLPDGSVRITSKEYRDELARIVASFPGGEDSFLKMIRNSFEPLPKREPFVIHTDK